ncbi:MAG: galactose ABC transporter substrate-binding protein [Anaerorhabdus sp.]
MKKLTAVVLVGLMALTLGACGSKGGKDSGKKEVKVGLAIYKYDDPFMTNYRTELESYLKERGTKDGVTYKLTSMDGKNDQGEQQNQIDNFIADKVDVLIANLVEPANAKITLDKAKKADIPVVFINREPSKADVTASDKVAYVGAKAQQSGEYQGEMIAELENKGDYNKDGKLNYVMIVGDPQNIDAKQRTEFSIKKYQEMVPGTPVEKLLEQRGDWDQAKGQEIAAAALTQFGEKIDVIFANNDNMAIGALQAIKAAGRTVGKDIALVGVDALDEAQKLVQSGEMTGTVLNDAINQSHTAVDTAIKLVNKEKLSDNYAWVNYVKVNGAYFKK